MQTQLKVILKIFLNRIRIPFFLQEIHQSKTYDNGRPNSYKSRNHETVVQNPGTGFCSSGAVKINRCQITWIKTKEEIRIRSLSPITIREIQRTFLKLIFIVFIFKIGFDIAAGFGCNRIEYYSQHWYCNQRKAPLKKVFLRSLRPKYNWPLEYKPLADFRL